jgi:hypothetical protein
MAKYSLTKSYMTKYSLTQSYMAEYALTRKNLVMPTPKTNETNIETTNLFYKNKKGNKT